MSWSELQVNQQLAHVSMYCNQDLVLMGNYINIGYSGNNVLCNLYFSRDYYFRLFVFFKKIQEET